MKTAIGEYKVLPNSAFKIVFSYLMILALWAVMAMSLCSCGLMTSQGHMEFAGDQHGIRAFSDMINGLAASGTRHPEYFKTRRLQETEETYREAQPGFWSKLLIGGFAAKGRPAEEDQGS